MRHLVSVLLGMVTGPLVLLLAGRGLVGLADAAQADRTDHFGLVTAGSALGLAGLVYTVLTQARLAPLGPTLVGAGYVAIGVFALRDPVGYLAAIQDNPAVGGAAVGLADEHLLLAAQIAPLLAVPLLATFVMPSRWRRQNSRMDDVATSASSVPADTRTDTPTDTLDDIPRVAATGVPATHPPFPAPHPPPYPTAPHALAPQPPHYGAPPHTATSYPPYATPPYAAPPFTAPPHPAPPHPAPPPTAPPHAQFPQHPQFPRYPQHPQQPAPESLPQSPPPPDAPSDEVTLSLSPERTTTNLGLDSGSPPPGQDSPAGGQAAGRAPTDRAQTDKWNGSNR